MVRPPGYVASWDESWRPPIFKLWKNVLMITLDACQTCVGGLLRVICRRCWTGPGLTRVSGIAIPQDQKGWPGWLSRLFCVLLLVIDLVARLGSLLLEAACRIIIIPVLLVLLPRSFRTVGCERAPTSDLEYIGPVSPRTKQPTSAYCFCSPHFRRCSVGPVLICLLGRSPWQI